MAVWYEEWCEIQCGWRLEARGMGEDHVELGQGLNVEVLQNQAEFEHILWQQWEMIRSMTGFSDVEIRDERNGNDLSPNTSGKLEGMRTWGEQCQWNNSRGTQISKTERVEEAQEGGPFNNFDVSHVKNSSSLTDNSPVCPVDICLNGRIVTGDTFFFKLLD